MCPKGRTVGLAKVFSSHTFSQNCQEKKESSPELVDINLKYLKVLKVFRCQDEGTQVGGLLSHFLMFWTIGVAPSCPHQQGTFQNSFLRNSREEVEAHFPKMGVSITGGTPK